MSDSEGYPPDFDLVLFKQLTIEDFQFTPERVVGRGSFGIVYLIKTPSYDKPMALKLVLQDRRYKNREFTILSSLRHPCTTLLRRSFFIPAQQNSNDLILYIVMDYYPETVHSLYRQYTRVKQHVPLIYTRVAMWQLARALLCLHLQNITHRDVKPTNVLFDPKNLKTVLCDFGSAKQLNPGEQNVAYICSRYYRAPELVLGAVLYTQQIDIWSFGCILGEVLLGQPLFPGESSVDQFVEIIKVLGSPSSDELTAMNSNIQSFRFKDVKPFGLSKIFKTKAHVDAVDLLEKVLVYDPSRRLTAVQILNHPFFNEMKTLKTAKILPDGQELDPEIFELTEEEIAAGVLMDFDKDEALEAI